MVTSYTSISQVSLFTCTKLINFWVLKYLKQLLFCVIFHTVSRAHHVLKLYLVPLVQNTKYQCQNRNTKPRVNSGLDWRGIVAYFLFVTLCFLC